MDETKRSTTAPSIDDFIGEDGVLTKILSKLPLKDAVRTSVLSRRWRYIWTYLPNIHVFCPNHHNFYMGRGIEDFDEYLLAKETDKTVQIMDSVLKRHCGFGVESFRVDMPFYEKHAGSLDQWVAFAATANTKEFFMEFKSMGNKCSYDFPFHLLFQQNWQSSIKSMCLQSCSLQVPDGTIGCLRSLQTLEIHSVSICDADFQNLVSTCAVMEQLVVSWCTELMNMSIHQQSGRLKHLTVDFCFSLISIDVQTEKLISFIYAGKIINFSFQDVSCITEGKLDLISFDSLVLDFVLMKLPNLLPQFQKLELGFQCVPELIHLPKMSCHQFEHLKHLTMAINFVKGGSILLLIALLTLAPYLEKLTSNLYMGYREMHMEVPIHNISLAHLKEVEIVGFIGSAGELNFLQYLFNNASTLRSMKISVLGVIKYYQDCNQWFLHSRNETISDYIKRIAPPDLDLDISSLTY